MKIKTSMYQRYLVVDQIAKRMESVGAKPGTVIVFDDHVHISLSYGYGYGESYGAAEEREDLVNKFLTRYPDATIARQVDYPGGKPQMIVSGTAAHGIEWKIDFRDGVCEMVQVGTKKVERVDPEVYATLPRVEVNEPVYEYRCPDPIVAAGLL